MKKKTHECKQCSCEATIEYNYDEIGEEPSYCPFCGSSYIEEDIDKMEYPDDSMGSEW